MKYKLISDTHVCTLILPKYSKGCRDYLYIASFSPIEGWTIPHQFSLGNARRYIKYIHEIKEIYSGTLIDTLKIKVIK